MNKFTYLLTFLLTLLLAFTTNAQLKKDGTPDMRYKANKQAYGNSYSTPSYNYSNTTYSTPSYSTNSSVRYQSGYTKSNGTYVQPHYKTNTNSTNRDNFSTSGNYNAYTGKTGSRAQDYSSGAYNYGKGQQIQTGSKGGQYYVNSKGNKVYVPKRH